MPIQTNIIIDYLCEEICEAESEIEQCEECVSCMRSGIIENQQRIIYSEGIIDNAENTLAQIGYEDDGEEDFNAVDDDTVKFETESAAFEAITSMLEDPGIHYVKLQRSTKDGAEYRVDPVMYDEDSEDDTRQSAAAYQAIKGMVDNPDTNCVQLRRSDKDDIAFDISLVKDDVKDSEEHQITVSVSGE